MKDLRKIFNEKLIKDKSRVLKHGEVFTSQKIVNEMLSLNAIKDSLMDINTTFLEPTAGEGSFLVNILNRKLEIVSKKYNESLKMYENYSLYALTTVYGIELLEDNLQNCTMNLFQVFYDHYEKQISQHNGTKNKKVIESAKIIISANTSQGDFLKRKKISGEPIIFSEWSSEKKGKENIEIIRTEYTIEEISQNLKKEPGIVIDTNFITEQIDLFDYLLEIEEDNFNYDGKKFKYTQVAIVDIYRQAMEEYI